MKPCPQCPRLHCVLLCEPVPPDQSSSQLVLLNTQLSYLKARYRQLTGLGAALTTITHTSLPTTQVRLHGKQESSILLGCCQNYIPKNGHIIYIEFGSPQKIIIISSKVKTYLSVDIIFFSNPNSVVGIIQRFGVIELKYLVVLCYNCISQS